MTKVRDFLNKKWIFLIWIGICFAIACFLKLYKLDSIPVGLHVDEAGAAYDSWSLANFGVDRWLKSYPIYLYNTGGGSSIMMPYIAMLLIRLNGGEYSTFLIRLPGVMLSLVAFLAGIYIIYKLLGKVCCLYAAPLLAVVPYFLMQCRFALDCNCLVSVMTVAIAVLLYVVENGKGKKWYFVAGIAYGLTYYCYSMSFIANSLVLVIILVLLFMFKKSKLSELVCMLIPVVLLGLPLASMLMINQLNLNEQSFLGITLTKLSLYRASEMTIDPNFNLKNLGIVLSDLFTYDWLPYNSNSSFYVFFRISAPFAIIGIIFAYKDAINSMKMRKWDPIFVPVIVSFVYIIIGMMLGGDGPNINRLNGTMFCMFVFLIYGINCVLNKIKNIRKIGKKTLIAVSLILVFVYVNSAIKFIDYYYNKYPTEVYPQILFFDTYEDILAKIDEEECPVYIENEGDLNIYFMLSTMVNPYDFNLPQNPELEFKNYKLALPDEFMEDSYYIVNRNNDSYIDFLEENGAEEICSSNMYRCFLSKAI